MTTEHDICWEFINHVTFSFNQVIPILNNGDFDDVSFSTVNNLVDILVCNKALRTKIFKIFKTTYKPDVYAIMILLLLYKNNPVLTNSFTCWTDATDQLIFDIDKTRVIALSKKSRLQCLCGCKITKVYKIRYGVHYSIMGRVCIYKTNVTNEEELYFIERINCSLCDRNRPRPIPYDFTQDICKRCLNKQNK